MLDRLAIRLPAIAERLLPPDPGSLRLLTAFSATLAGLITFFEIDALGAFLPFAIPDRVLGFAIALFCGATVRDATPGQRAVTIGLAPFASFAAVILATIAPRRFDVAAWLLPAIMFAATYAATRGPRWASLGAVTLIAFFLCLVSRPTPDMLPMRLVALLLAATNVVLLRLIILPQRPEAELARLRRSISRAMARILGAIAAAQRNGQWRNDDRARMRRELDRLGEAMAMTEQRVRDLSRRDPRLNGLGARQLAIELATERTAEIALAGLAPVSETPAIGAALAALQAALNSGTAPPPVDAGSSRLGEAIGMLAGALCEPAPRDAPPIPPPPPAAGGSGLWLAIEAAAASGLAIVASNALLPSRWYWAAFAAFVMFQGVGSRGDSILKAFQFVGGTVLGAGVGILVALLLRGHEWLEVAAIVVATFLAFQASTAAYGLMILWITVIIAQLFGLLGYFVPELMLTRLAETAIGAASGLLVALIAPIGSTAAAEKSATVAFLRSLDGLVGVATRAMVADAASRELPGALLAIEQTLRDLRAAARPTLDGVTPMGRPALRRRILALESCEVWAREFGRVALSERPTADERRADEIREVAARIHTLVGRICAAEGAAIVASGGRETDDDLPAEAFDASADQPTRFLLRIEAVLRHLERN